MKKLVKASIGDEILAKESIRGIVEKVYENSVIITIKSNTGNLDFPNNKTVIAHKNYNIIRNAKQ